MKVHSIVSTSVIDRFTQENSKDEPIGPEVAICSVGLLLKGIVPKAVGFTEASLGITENDVEGFRCHRDNAHHDWVEVAYGDKDPTDDREIVLVASFEEFDKARPIELLGRVGLFTETPRDLGDDYATYVEEVMGGELSGNDWPVTLALFQMLSKGVRDPVIHAVSFETKLIPQRLHVMAFYKLPTEEVSNEK